MRCFCLYAFHFATIHVDGVNGQNIPFWSDFTIAPSSSHYSNEVLFIVLIKGCLRATLPQGLLVWWCYCIVFLDLVRQDTNNLYNSHTAILGLLDTSFTIFLTVCGDDMYLHPLPGKFATIPYVSLCFIIALTVLSGMFNVYACFCTHYPTCDGKLSSMSSELPVLWLFPLLTRDFVYFYTIVKQEVMEWRNIVPLDHRCQTPVLEGRCVCWLLGCSQHPWFIQVIDWLKNRHTLVCRP